MEINKDLVADAVAENVEQTTEKTAEEKKYTQEEVDAIVGNAKARTKAKITKEYDRKYEGLTNVLKAGTGIESVEEMILEGKAMHHCVGTYYKRADSLILSATIDGRRIETIEVSLKTLQVVQSRGACNANTEYHDRIINLVNSNINLIRQRMKAA